MQQIKKKCSKMFALLMAFILMFSTVDPITVKATGSTASNVLRQANFEGLSATDDVVGAIGYKNKATFSLGIEEENQYASFSYDESEANKTLFTIQTSSEPSQNKTIWITMDLRLKQGVTNGGIIQFRTKGQKETDSLENKALFMLVGGVIRVGNTKYKSHDFSTWKTVVCEINENEHICTIYIASNGDLTAVCDGTSWTGSVTEFKDLQVITALANTSGAWELDNVAIYQNDTYVDLFAEVDEPEQEPTYVAQIGEGKYETLQGAIDEAAEGNTITLLDDITENSIELDEKITLDLNGNILTATYFNAINGTHVIDSSDDKEGRLNVPADTSTLSSTNSQVPIYIAGEGYMFATMLGQASVSKTDDSFTVISRPSFGDAYSKLAGGANAAKLQFIIRLDWTEADGAKYQEFYYDEATVQAVYGEAKAFSVTVNGLTGYTENMKVTVLVRSTDLEVDWVNNEFYMSSAN